MIKASFSLTIIEKLGVFKDVYNYEQLDKLAVLDFIAAMKIALRAVRFRMSSSPK